MNETVGDVSTLVRKCGAPTKTGGICNQVVPIHSVTGRCMFHDPERAEEATAARARGGHASHERAPGPNDVPPPAEPKTLDDVCRWLSWVVVAHASGQIDKTTATGLTYALQQLKSALAVRDLEEKYKALVVRLKVLEGAR